MGKYLDIARKFEARQQVEKQGSQQPSPDYRTLYRQTAEAMEGDCWALNPLWLLEHPAFYEQIRALDDKLTTMERIGASESEYRATLARLVACIRDARALSEQEARQKGEEVEQ